MFFVRAIKINIEKYCKFIIFDILKSECFFFVSFLITVMTRCMRWVIMVKLLSFICDANIWIWFGVLIGQGGRLWPHYGSAASCLLSSTKQPIPLAEELKEHIKWLAQKADFSHRIKLPLRLLLLLLSWNVVLTCGFVCGKPSRSTCVSSVSRYPLVNGHVL